MACDTMPFYQVGPGNIKKHQDITYNPECCDSQCQSENCQDCSKRMPEGIFYYKSDEFHGLKKLSLVELPDCPCFLSRSRVVGYHDYGLAKFAVQPADQGHNIFG